MSTSLSARLQVQTQFALDQTNPAGDDSIGGGSDNKVLTFANGVGAGQCNKPYTVLAVIAPSGTLTLNLTNNSLNDQLNIPITMARVKGIIIRLLDPNDALGGTLCSGVHLNGLNGTDGMIDGTTPKLRVFNGGFVAWATPSAAGCVSGLTVAIVNDDAVVPANVLITILGAST